MPPEEIRLRIGNLAKAVLITGQACQGSQGCPQRVRLQRRRRVCEAGRQGERITVFFRRQGRHPLLALYDSGRGMDADRLRQLARSLFDSSQAGDGRTFGERAIGILAIQQLSGRCEVVTW